MFKQNILKTKKIATKFLSWFLLVALLPLFFFGYLNYSNFSKSLNNEVMKGLIAIADNKVHHIETYILERERDAVVISHASDVISAMEKLENIAKKYGMDSPHYLAVDKQLRKSFTGINEIYGLHDIFLITLNGDVIFTVAKEDDYGTNLKTGSYKDSELAKSFTRTRTLIETAISDFDFYDPSNQPAAFISAPILKKKNLIGVLALQLKTKEIYSLAKDYNGLGETGETVLAMQRGDEAVFVAPTRHDPVAAFGQKIALGSQKAAPIQEAIRGRRGSGKSIDYRDTEVLAVWRYLPHLRWGIVIKIDTEEAFAAALNLRNWSLILGIMAVLIVIVLSLLVSKSISNPIIKLTQTTKLIAGGDLTSRINIASDDEIGQLGDAFNKMVEDLKSSQNRLVDRSRQLAVSNEQLQQEITERKQAEEELAKLATAIKQAHETVMILGTDGIVTYVNPALEKQMGYSSSELIGKSLISFDRRPDQKNIFQKAWETINKGNIWAGHMSPTSKEGSIREFDVTVSPIRDSSGKITSFVSIARNVTKELEMEERLHRAEKMEAIGTLAGGVAHDLNNVLGGIVGYPDLLLHDISEDSPMRSSLLAIKQSGQRAAAIVQDLLTLARRGVQVTKVVNLNTILTTSLKSVEYKKMKNLILT